MQRYIIAIFTGFIAINVLSALSAMLVLQPTINHLLLPHIRSQEEGLNFPSLTMGYLIITLGILFTLKNFKAGRGWLQKSFYVGASIGLSVCLGDHLVTAGWSKLHMGAMAFSGIVDTIPLLSATVCMGYFLRKDLE